MTGRLGRKWIGLLVVLAAGLMAGCGAARPAATSQPTSNPATTPVLNTNRLALQTLVPASALTDLEIAAAYRGVATYTGYACVIAPAGCACEDPLIQDASFTFSPDNRLYYDFTIKGGTPGQWQLDHAGYNQWSYTTPITVGQGQNAKQDAILLALLTFVQDGYQITEVATFSTGEISKCSDITFHRLGAPGATPTP